MNPLHLHAYEADAGKLRAAIADCTPEQLESIPIAGKWSIQQVLVHLLDSDLIWTYRMKLALAEDSPTLTPYDESAFAQRLRCELWSADDALTIFELNRRNFARVLRGSPADALARSATHLERGPLTVAQMFEHLLPHVDHHLKFIHEKRKILFG